jgi:hypothetical protein
MKTLIQSASKLSRFAGFFVCLILISLTASTEGTDKSYYDGSIRLNPDCKVKRLSTGAVHVFTKDKDGSEVKHEFTDFYADLIMAAYRKQRIEFIVDSLGKKYYLSEDDCRRELKHAVNVLSEWKILYRDDQVATR